VKRAALLVALLLAGCHGEGEAPRSLRVSAIPDQDAPNVKAQHWPVIQLVCGALAVRCEWVALDSYDAVVDSLGNGSIDLAFLGGATYWRAHAAYGANAVAIRDVDAQFSSSLVVREDSPARRLQDLAHARLTFGNRASTSGHVMARYFLVRQGIQPESFFSRVGYAAQHEATLAAVAGGLADAGVVNSAIAAEALGRGGRYERRLRVVWESPTFVDYVWATRPGIPPAFRAALTDAFLDLDRESPEQGPALKAAGAGGFLPDGKGDYDQVGEALRTMPVP
jgi:phosphonate transport system substrate-binding protein